MDLGAFMKKLAAKECEFKMLPMKVRVALVGHVKTQGATGEDVAAFFGIPLSTAYWLWHKYCRQVAGLVKAEASRWIGRVVARGEWLYAAAKKKGDLDLCWKIEIDLFDRLQKMGLIDQRAEEANINFTIDKTKLQSQLDSNLTLLERVKQRASAGYLTAPSSAEGEADLDVEATGGNGHDGNGADVSTD